MIYEMRTYDLKVGGVQEFEENFSKVIDERQKFSRMVGFFHSEIGDLNRVMHIWEYENSAHRDDVRQQLSGKSWWPPKNAHLIESQVTKMLTTPSFKKEPLTGELGNFYEFRTYTIFIGKMLEVTSRWEKEIASREAVSPLAACFMTDMGTLNEFIHVWPYQDLNHRMDVRIETHKMPNWPPGSRPFIAKQNTEIWMPASFSEMS